MKLKKGFACYETEDGMILAGTKETGFDGMIRLNKSAAFIVSHLQEETTREELLSRLTETFDADQKILEEDLTKVLETLKECRAL